MCSSLDRIECRRRIRGGSSWHAADALHASAANYSYGTPHLRRVTTRSSANPRGLCRLRRHWSRSPETPEFPSAHLVQRPRVGDAARSVQRMPQALRCKMPHLNNHNRNYWVGPKMPLRNTKTRDRRIFSQSSKAKRSL